MIHEQQMALAGTLVEHGTRDTVGLAPAVGGGDVTIDVTLPDVHGHWDVFQSEPPVDGEQPVVLRPPLDRSSQRRAGSLLGRLRGRVA